MPELNLDLQKEINKMNLAEKAELQALGQNLDAQGNILPDKKPEKKEARASKPRMPKGIAKAVGMVLLGAAALGFFSGDAQAAEMEDLISPEPQSAAFNASDKSVGTVDTSALLELTPASNSDFVGMALERIYGTEVQLYPGTNEYSVGFGDLFPTNNAAMQAEWWNSVDAIYGLNTVYSAQELGENPNLLLANLREGDIIYLQSAHSSLGYNQFSRAYIVSRGENGETSFLAYEGTNYINYSFEDVLNEQYGEGESRDYAPTYEGTGTAASLAIMHVQPDRSLRLLERESWRNDPNMQLPLFDEESARREEMNRMFRPIETIGFYGGIRAWGNLSRDDAGNEIMNASDFVSNYWHRYDQIIAAVENPAQVTPSLDLIVLSADGTYSSYTTGIIEQLLYEQEHNDRPLPRLTFNFRIPDDWDMQETTTHILGFLTTDTSVVDQRAIQRYIQSGGEIGISLDPEMRVLETGIPLRAEEVNELYKDIVMTIRNQYYANSSETFSSDVVHFNVYDMSNGSLVQEQESIFRGVQVIDMSIADSRETKERTVENLDTRRGNGGSASMLFSHYVAPYLLEQDEADMNQEHIYYDRFLTDPSSIIDFATETGQTSIYFQ